MKKVSKDALLSPLRFNPRTTPDDIPDDYDFSKMVRAKPPHRFSEGERVYINGAPFVVKGRGFIPDPPPSRATTASALERRSSRRRPSPRSVAMKASS